MEVVSFDGQTVWADKSTPLYEVGNFLGGGAAGTVYEAEHVKSKEHFALKILTPLGYKLLSPALLRRCSIITKGKAVPDFVEQSEEGLSVENVWWLLNGSTKQYLAAYYSEKNCMLRELSLKQCMSIWGPQPAGVTESDDGKIEVLQSPEGTRVYVPSIPPKYAEFVRRRSRIFREILNMRKISNHRNVIRLEGVLELTQESKCTIFLVMELANGGELFDRIKIDCGTREDTAVLYFRQLLNGVQHCHEVGVCHRDLKPENLLLQDAPGNGTVLKIADFGFSAWVAIAVQDDNWDGRAPQRLPEVQQQVYAAGTPPASASLGAIIGSASNQALLLAGSPLRQLTSVVGSPFYVAPEVLQARGYDGYKADVWSLGVILYAMIAGNLPFSQELATCKRFRAFCRWVREMAAKGVYFYDNNSIEYPEWLFPNKFSADAKSLIVSMLHPEPSERVTVSEAMVHPWCLHGLKSTAAPLGQLAIINNPGAVIPVSYSQNSSNNFQNIDSQSTPLSPGADSSTIAPTTLRSTVGETMEVVGDDDADASGTYDEATDDADGMHIDDDEDDNIFQMDDAVPVAPKSVPSTRDSSVSAGSPPSRRLPSQLLSEHSGGRVVSPPVGQHSENYALMMRQDMDGRYAATAQYSTRPPVPPSSSAAVPVPIFSGRSTSSAGTPCVSRSGSAAFGSPSHPVPAYSLEALITSGAPAPPDLFTDVIEDDLPSPAQVSGISALTKLTAGMRPPSFHDHVKKSTRFLTSVAASEVLEKIECVLMQCKEGHLVSPLGPIRKIELSWETYRLDIWGADITGSALCSIQLYRLSTDGLASRQDFASQSPSAFGSGFNSGQVASGSSAPPSPGGALGLATAPQYLVEFVRGPIEIFAFKRFYDFIRQQVAELVKKDYGSSSLDQFGSPTRPGYSLMSQAFRNS